MKGFDLKMLCEIEADDVRRTSIAFLFPCPFLWKENLLRSKLSTTAARHEALVAPSRHRRQLLLAGLLNKNKNGLTYFLRNENQKDTFELTVVRLDIDVGVNI